MGKSSRSYESSESQADFAEPDQTLIIYDWDDTLCPSCWIQDERLSLFEAPPQDERFAVPLHQLEQLVEGLLATTKKLGHVVIVTCAQAPWVESSCRNFLPSLESLIRTIPVRYASRASLSFAEEEGGSSERASRLPVAVAAAEEELRQQAQQAGVGPSGGGAPASSLSRPAAPSRVSERSLGEVKAAHRRWKEIAFREEIESFYSRYDGQSWKNIVCIGDSFAERDATRSCVATRPSKSRRCRTKTAKLLDEPSLEELIRQIKVLHDGIGLIVRYDGNLDIQINEKDIDFDMDVIERLVSKDD